MNFPTFLAFFLFHPFPNSAAKIYQNATELYISGLTGTFKYETLSDFADVSKLKIFDNRVTKIEPGAVCSSPSVKSVELNFAGNSEAPTLTNDVFRLCQFQLQQLFIRLDFDNPSQIDKEALRDLNLRELSLQCHKVGILDQDFLTLNSLNLTRLVLSNCYIHKIDRHFFSRMEKLEEVEISYNRNLTHLPKNVFIKTPNLKRLFLQYNRIRELEWDEFAGLNFLQELDLSGNRLAFFDARNISENLPNLRRFKILKNLLPCQLKEKFSSDLNSLMNHSVEVVYTHFSCREY